MANKAVEEPMLMSCKRIITVDTRKREFSGMRRVGWTRLKKGEKGRPWSRANAQVRRDTEARELNMAIMPLKMSKERSAIVADFEPVALYTT